MMEVDDKQFSSLIPTLSPSPSATRWWRSRASWPPCSRPSGSTPRPWTAASSTASSRGSVRRSHSRGDDRLLLLARTTTTKEDFWNLIAKDGSLHEIRKLYKIGPRHLNCRQRVKLAVLILSMSVSNAFQLKEETKAQIIRTIDELKIFLVFYFIVLSN